MLYSTNMKDIKIIMKPNSEVHAKLMKRPAYKKAFDDLEVEFKLIDAIIEQRLKYGVTQKQLAEKVGMKQSAIARFESGNCNPTLDFLKKIASALDMKLTATAI